MRNPEAPWMGIEIRYSAGNGEVAKVTGPYASREAAFEAYGITAESDKRTVRKYMLLLNRESGYTRRISIKQLAPARQVGWLK